MINCLVLFVEGETEVVFYNRLIEYARKLNDNKEFPVKISIKNVKGISKFEKEVVRIFVKSIKPNNDDKIDKYIVALCRDTDKPELSQYPEINWKLIEKELKNNGASKIIHVKAKSTIEDWFLIDHKNILKFLGQPITTKVYKSKDGLTELKRLFKKANKVYFKGGKAKGFIHNLDMKLIVEETKDQLEPIFNILGIKI